jgi:DivIVA domain-containing protein
LDGHSIDRIRNASFAHAVRGYDRHEVDQFLSELADWLENDTGEVARSNAVRAELERVASFTPVGADGYWSLPAAAGAVAA